MSTALQKHQFQIEDNRRVAKTLSEPVAEGHEPTYLAPSTRFTPGAGDAGAGQEARPESRESLEHLLTGLQAAEAPGMVDLRGSADGEVHIGEQPFQAEVA